MHAKTWGGLPLDFRVSGKAGRFLKRLCGCSMLIRKNKAVPICMICPGQPPFDD